MHHWLLLVSVIANPVLTIDFVKVAFMVFYLHSGYDEVGQIWPIA